MRLALGAAISVVLAGGAFGQPDGSSCAVAFNMFNVTDRFPGVVAHGIHDISVEDLRTFESDVPCKSNGVPTVNRDLVSDHGVLPDAPCVEDGKSPFGAGTSMRVVDTVLSHMDDKKYDVGRYSGLERLVHAFHMHHVWSRAALQYRALEKSPPSYMVCECARDVESNGVMKMLRFPALQIREPDLMYGWTTEVNGKRMSWGGNLYNYAFFPKGSAEKDVLSQTPSVPRLLRSADWEEWKKLMASMQPGDDFELAVFLYCVLNVAHV